MANSWSTQQSNSGVNDKAPVRGWQDLPPGTHLVTARRGYRHHGIYVGGGRVVHYSGLSSHWRRGPVEEVPLEQFAGGRPVFVKPAAQACYGATQIVARARSRLGEDCYRIASNNCEHFCEWCIHGRPRSEQVDSLLAGSWLVPLRRLLPLFVRPAVNPAGPADASCAA